MASTMATDIPRNESSSVVLPSMSLATGFLPRLYLKTKKSMKKMITAKRKAHMPVITQKARSTSLPVIVAAENMVRPLFYVLVPVGDILITKPYQHDARPEHD